ncbi:MAG: serine hydrolase [Selenomonadaceae bacterium]|nr:serine hydrolase [Selenomonadaceae bacterium]
MNIARMIKFFLLFAVVVTIETAAMCYLWTTEYSSDSSAGNGQDQQVSREIPETAPDREDVLARIRGILGEEDASFSVYVLRPSEEKEPIVYQSRPLPPASMIKLFVMAKAMQDVKDGKATLDDAIVLRERDMVGGAGVLVEYADGTRIPLRKVIEFMITESDNTATNLLINRIGMDEINRYLKENGYTDTIMKHKMMLSPKGRRQSNLSSAKDIGLLLSRIYRGECVGDPYDTLMIGFLALQKDDECFPKALPSWRIAHKTGEVDGLYDDGGIFYGKEGRFILVIMNEEYSGRSIAIQKMQEIARYVGETVTK